MLRLVFSLLLLSGCGAAYNAQHGTSTGAHCTVVNPAGTQIMIPVTSPGTVGWNYPTNYLVGWEQCYLPAGTRVMITGPGDLKIGTTRVISSGAKVCSGNAELSDLGQCSGGETMAEAIFPFLKPMPILRSY